VACAHRPAANGSADGPDSDVRDATENADVTPDPFEHLPTLQPHIRPAAQSPLRVTPEVVARWDAQVLQSGRSLAWRKTDAQIEASRREVLAGLGADDDLWVFSYGSLMWDPGFYFAEVRRADLAGFRRRFSFLARISRGTEARPGLMLSIEPGPGHCRGLAFRIAAAQVAQESTVLWRREMIRGSYCPAFLPVATPQGIVNALVFTGNPGHDDHVNEMPLAETAAVIANAAGVMGTNREYLEQLAAQLGVLGIDDPYVEALMARVRECGGA
jgi:glutathione-specific gamma-glutamylcyclotransferase